MNTITVRILIFLLCLFVLATLANQLTHFFEDDYKTETAMLYSSAEKVSFKGVYIRKESVVNSSINGVLSYPSPDGSKIAKNSVVAYIYKDENSIYIKQQIQKLEEEVKLLESAQSPGTTDVAQPEFISSLIEEKYQTITSLIAKNNLDTLSIERKNFQTLLGIYQIIINEETDYNNRINELNSQIAALKAEQKEPMDVVTVSDSGYFISYVDGYESMLSPDKLDNVSSALIKKIISDEETSERKSEKYIVGKMVDGYKWNMVGIVNIKQNDFKVGNIVKLKFTSTPDIVEAEITALAETENEDENIIILSCDKLTYNFVQRRVERVELILNDYEGIKIPRESVRFNKNNEKGVYVLVGEKVAFKKLDIVYECDEYLLSKFTSDTEYVSIYDDVIVEGEVAPEDFAVTTALDEDDNDIMPPDTGSEVTEPTVTEATVIDSSVTTSETEQNNNVETNNDSIVNNDDVDDEDKSDFVFDMDDIFE